jgi:hypothetical protein
VALSKKAQALLDRLLASKERYEIIGEALFRFTERPDPSTHYRDFEVHYYVDKVMRELGVSQNEAAKIVEEQWGEIAEQARKVNEARSPIADKGLENCPIRHASHCAPPGKNEKPNTKPTRLQSTTLTRILTSGAMTAPSCLTD